MAYTLGNKCTKNCCKRTILVQLIVKDMVVIFLEHSVYIHSMFTKTSLLFSCIAARTINKHEPKFQTI